VTSPGFPVVLLLEGSRCLVVGGGSTARGKVEALVGAGAIVTVVAPQISEAIAGLGVETVRRPYRAADLAGRLLVITTTGDPTIDAAVFADARAAGVLVNSVDDPAHCDFTLPAITRRGAVSVAVSTNGTSPALARWLRDRLADALPGELEALTAAVVEARAALRSRGLPTEGLPWFALIEEIRAAIHDDPAAVASVVSGFVERSGGGGGDQPADLGGTVTV
jgi:precorrin-2 dehydrogenase/sirohydrochlorin ferrochelatase